MGQKLGPAGRRQMKQKLAGQKLGPAGRKKVPYKQSIIIRRANNNHYGRHLKNDNLSNF